MIRHLGQYRWLALGLGLTALLQFVVVLRSPVIARDGIGYINLSKRLGEDFVSAIREADHAPGYSALLWAAYHWPPTIKRTDSLDSRISNARLITGAFGLLSTLLMWLLTLKLFDRQVAAVAVVLFSVLPLFRQNAADVLTDTPHLTVCLLAVCLAIEGFRRANPLFFSGTGLVSGLAYWLRPEGLSVALVTAGLLAIWARKWGGMRLRTIIVSLGALVAGAALVIMPYWLLSHNLVAKGAGAGLASAGWKQEILSAPLVVLWGSLREFGRELGQSLRYVLLVPLGLALLADRTGKPERIGRITCLAFCLFYFALSIAFYAVFGYLNRRYLMVPVALLTPWIGFGFILLAGRIVRLPPDLARRSSHSAQPGKPRKQTRVLSLIVTIVVVSLAVRSMRPIHRHRIDIFEAARWLRNHSGESDGVLSNSVYVPFYAERPGKVLSDPSEPIPNEAIQEGPSPFPFVVLDLRSSNLSDEWLSVLERRYRKVAPALEGIRAGTVAILERHPDG